MLSGDCSTRKLKAESFNTTDIPTVQELPEEWCLPPLLLESLVPDILVAKIPSPVFVVLCAVAGLSTGCLDLSGELVLGPSEEDVGVQTALTLLWHPGNYDLKLNTCNQIDPLRSNCRQLPARYCKYVVQSFSAVI